MIRKAGPLHPPPADAHGSVFFDSSYLQRSAITCVCSNGDEKAGGLAGQTVVIMKDERGNNE